MAKVLKYTLCKQCKVDNEIKNILTEISSLWSPKAEEIAKKEAYNGEYTIVEDSNYFDPASIPSKDDKFEAQLTYTAMMTGTLLEEV